MGVVTRTASKAASRREALPRLRRTTVALPADLLDAADRAVARGSAKSRAELLARALRRELAAHQRAAVDAAFEAMADDPAYQAEAVRIAEEFRTSDWEALRLGARDR